MTTQQIPSLASVTPYTPAWGLYVYDERAFFTFEGRLIAQASVTTPDQDARIARVFQRLTGRITAHQSSHESMEEYSDGYAR